MSENLSKVGYIVQASGIGAFAIGGILSFHHLAIAACFVSGAAALFVGHKLRTI